MLMAVIFSEVLAPTGRRIWPIQMIHFGSDRLDPDRICVVIRQRADVSCPLAANFSPLVPMHLASSSVFPPPRRSFLPSEMFLAALCYIKARPVAEGFPYPPNKHHDRPPSSYSGAYNHNGGESGNQTTSNGSAQGWQRQPDSSPSTSAGSYCNWTIGEHFSWEVLGEVMLLVVLQWQACQERRMELFEVVHANTDNAGLCAQFDKAVQELVEAATKVQALEVERQVDV
jgi:hypothetical protein